MADKEFSFDLSAGGSTLLTAGCEEFSLQPCTQAEERAPKRKKASDEEPWRAVDSQLTVLEGEEGDNSDYEEFMVGLRASFAANVDRLLASNPNIMLVDFPACCVRPPGVEFPKPPCTPRLDG
jgi:hypothetical protein